MLAGCLCLLVDALPSPQPIPAPEPFFGLGLLGRLLAAYSSGDKDEDKGNCKCNRRTFHTKEKDKDKVGSNPTLTGDFTSDNCRTVRVTRTQLLSATMLPPTLMTQ